MLVVSLMCINNQLLMFEYLKFLDVSADELKVRYFVKESLFTTRVCICLYEISIGSVIVTTLVTSKDVTGIKRNHTWLKSYWFFSFWKNPKLADC